MARVLVVDDEELIRLTLTQALEQDGHSVTEASDGDECLAKMREDPADVVVTDILMPNKEGLETIAELRRLYSSVKIIAISGGGRIHNTSFLEIAKVVGADAALKKPFENRTLCDVVRANIALEDGAPATAD